MADKSKTGKEYPSFFWEVERGKITELVKAIGDGNKIYTDKNFAVKEGYKDCPAPPTFVTVPMMWTNFLIDVINDLKMNYSRVVHGQEGYEYFKEIYPGDVLTGTMKVTSIDEKSGKSGSMDIVRLETIYKNQKEEQVVKATTILVERK